MRRDASNEAQEIIISKFSNIFLVLSCIYLIYNIFLGDFFRILIGGFLLSTSIIPLILIRRNYYFLASSLYIILFSLITGFIHLVNVENDSITFIMFLFLSIFTSITLNQKSGYIVVIFSIIIVILKPIVQPYINVIHLSYNILFWL